MTSNTEFLEIANVPVIVRPPANPSLRAPLIILWHGFGIPNSEELLAEVLPLEEVQAWKAYLGLPMFGKRLPAGGLDEVMQRQVEDYVLQLLLPVIEQAMQELPHVVDGLRSHYGIDEEGIGLFGFSAGGGASLLTLIENPLPITTAVLAGVTKDLVSAVDTFERGMKQYYPNLKESDTRYHWTEESVAAKHRLDFINRTAEITQRKPVPNVLFVHGMQDDTFPVSQVEELYTKLKFNYKEAEAECSLETFEHLGHQLDLAAAQNSPDLQQDIAKLQQVVTAWFNQHLCKTDTRRM